MGPQRFLAAGDLAAQPALGIGFVTARQAMESVVSPGRSAAVMIFPPNDSCGGSDAGNFKFL
jgi:hypothetical protein